jgi:hypothetical protein
MAKKVVIESVEERKNRIKEYLQGEDPVVRFVAESGMGLKRLFSEEVLLPPEYDYIEEPTRTVVKVRKDGKYGFTNVSGKVVTPCIYDRAESFSEGRACVEEIGRFCGFINEDGKEIISLSLEDYRRTLPSGCIQYLPVFENGRAIIVKNGLECVIDIDGNEILPCVGALMDLPHETVAQKEEASYSSYCYRDEETQMYGICSLSGERLTVPKYKEQPYRGWSSDGRYFIQVEERPDYDTKLFGLVDNKGVEVMPCIYDDYGLNVKDGLIFATKKKKEGVFSLDGEPIIKCAWWECRSAEAGTIWAENKNTCALFTRSGAIVLEEGPYDKCSPSIDGLLELRSAEYNRDYFYMDLWGNVMARGRN